MHVLEDIYFAVPLPDFKQTWMILLGDNILFPGHSTVRFLKSSMISNNALPLNYVSAKNILSPFTPSLSNHLILQIQIVKCGWTHTTRRSKVLSTMTFMKRPRRLSIIPKAIPCMCILVVNNDKYGKKPSCQVLHRRPGKLQRQTLP